MSALCCWGCFPIPVETEVESERILDSSIDDLEEQYQSTRITASTRGSQLQVHVVDEIQRGRQETRTVERTYAQKRVVIGLTPWEGAYHYTDWRPSDRAPDPTFEEGVVAMIMVIGGLALSPIAMPVCWITEGSASWDISTRFRNKSGMLLSFPEMGFAKFAYLVGWAKTLTHFTATEEQELDPEIRIDSDPANGAAVAVEIPGLVREVKRTSPAGTAAFDVSEWPVLLGSDQSVRVSMLDRERRASDVQVSVAAEVIGSALPEALWDHSYGFDTIHTEHGSIDFKAGTPRLAPLARAEADLLGQVPGREAHVRLAVTVRNDGKGSLYRLLARTRSESQTLDALHLIFGQLAPGAEVTRERDLPVAFLRPEESAVLTVEFGEHNGNQPPPLTVKIDGHSILRPNLLWTYRVEDNQATGARVVGNGNGVVERGESVDVVFTVKNTGRAPARSTVLDLELPQDPSFQAYGATEFRLGDLQPGGSAESALNVQIKPVSSLEALPFTVTVREGSFATETSRVVSLVFDRAVAPPVVPTLQTRYVATEGATLRSGASADAPRDGTARRGYKLRVTGELPDWLRVEVPAPGGREGKTRSVWIARADTAREPPEGVSTSVEDGYRRNPFRLPPIITFTEPRDGFRTTDDRIRVVASVASPESPLERAFLQVMAADGAARDLRISPKEGREGARSERVLSGLVDLDLGETRIVAVAENTDGVSRRSVTVHRVKEEGTTYLLAVGVDKYPGGKALRCAVKDCRLFHDFAVKEMGVRPGNAWQLCDEEATREAIIDRFARLLTHVRAEDTVIVFLAGHGQIERLGTTEVRYFVPYVTEWGSFYSRGVNMEDFERLLSRLEAERILVLADACYSGSIVKLRGGRLFSQLAGKGRLVVGYEGVAREDETLGDGGHGYLTYFFVEGLRTGRADDDLDGEISVHDAYEYADREIRKLTDGSGAWIEGGGNLVLKR